MNKVKIIITGFKPFCDYLTNSSQSLVTRIAHPAIISKIILDVSIRDVDAQIPRICQLALQSESKVIILHLGLDASIDRPVIELGAKNEMTFGCPDNDGKVRYKQPIDPTKSLESFRFSRIPMDKLGDRFDRRMYGGTYISNYVYYKSLWKCQSDKIDCLYVHIPLELDVQNDILDLINILCK